MTYDIEKEGCPMCDGSGLIWVALGTDGDVAREQCPVCDQLKRKERDDSSIKKEG